MLIRLQNPLNLSINHWRKTLPSSSSRPIDNRPHFFKPVKCAPLQRNQLQQEDQVEWGILCEPCNGKGWVICDFCQGQKTNVKADNKRIYRRCPSCRAIGHILCQNCKVFKCVTFPNEGDELSS